MKISPVICRIPFLSNVGKEPESTKEKKEIKKIDDEVLQRKKEEEKIMKQLAWEKLIEKPQKFERKVKKDGK